MQLPLKMLGTGLAYSLAAWIGATFTVTNTGMAIYWPANAVLLAIFLTVPRKEWLLLALPAFCAEVLIDLPIFPFWAGVSFGLINTGEAMLAAFLIRFFTTSPFEFNRVRDAGFFLLLGPVLASMVAAVFGAVVYVVLGRDDSSFLMLWRLWWFGDALGLLLFTPLFIGLWHALKNGLPRLQWLAVMEFLLLLCLAALLAPRVFTLDDPSSLGFHATPFLLVPLVIWAALRLGVLGAVMTVSAIAILALIALVADGPQMQQFNPQYSVWLAQEYLAILAVIAIGLSVLIEESRRQQQGLEQRVRERTLSLLEANDALNIANQQLQTLVSTDYLTGIANRRHFYEQAGRILQRTGSENEGRACLLMLDLDHFKRVNDHYGHEAGDRVLREFACAVVACIRPLDLFGRIGGEEFLILLPGALPEDAAEVAERIRLAAAALSVQHQEEIIRVTVSVGLAAWQPGQSLDSLISQADEALYSAKGGGRNCIRAYHPDS